MGNFLQVLFVCFSGLLFSKAEVLAKACEAGVKEETFASSFSKSLLQVTQTPGLSAKHPDSMKMCIVRDNHCADLVLDANWDDGVTFNQAPTLLWDDAQLVVARYDEDVRWLDALPQIPTLVYNRGESTSPFLPTPRNNLQIIQQQNVGREDQVFLEHIVRNYQHLAQVTVFLQGWPFGHCPGFLHAVRRAITHVLTPETAGPVTAGYLEGLAPVASTFWQYDIENGFLGLSLEMARHNLPSELGDEARRDIRDTYAATCSLLLGGKPCPSRHWVAEGAQWAVRKDRILGTPRAIYEKAMQMGEGWQGKFRGLVLEAMWPTLFGADQWEPTQVEYLPTEAAMANNRAHSSDDYCELKTPDLVFEPGNATESEAMLTRQARHLIWSCSQRAAYCERQWQLSKSHSLAWQADRQHWEIYDSIGFLPWYLKAKIQKVLFGASHWWPRNSPQAHQRFEAITDVGYSPTVVVLNGTVQLPEQNMELEEGADVWTVRETTEGVTFSRLNQWNLEEFLGCEGDIATTMQSKRVWELKHILNGFVRLFNVEDQKFLSLDDGKDGGFLYCMKEILEDSDQAAFSINGIRRKVTV